jgi:hypothetical protein
MRGPAIISAVGHLVVITVVWIGVPQILDRKDEEELKDRPVLVELVTIDEVTRAPPRQPPPAPEPPKPEPAKVEAPPPPPAPPPPAPPQAAPPQVAALPPPVPRPEPAPRPEPPRPEAKPTPPPPAPEQRRPVNAVPQAKPTPPIRQPQFDPDKITLLLDRTRRTPAAPQPEAPKPAPEPARAAEPQRPTNQAREVGETMTMSELDTIRLQIERCWNVPAGARDAQNMRVRIRINLNSDGSLNRPPEILDEGRMADPFYRTMAESARRAVNICTPLKNLPASKYERWREITLTFDAKELLGG